MTITIKEMLKANRDAVEILERLEDFIRATGDLGGCGQLHRAKLHLEYAYNEMKFVRVWPRSSCNE